MWMSWLYFSPSLDLADHVSVGPLDIFYALLHVHHHHHPLPLSVVMSHQPILMWCSRGVRLTVISPQVLLEGITPL